MIINGNLKIHTLGDGELQNAVIENLTNTAMEALADVAGAVVFDTTNNVLNFNDGTAWQAIGSTGGLGALQTEVDNIETASGGIFDAAGDFSGTGLDALGNITGSSSLLNALTQLDTAITAAAGVDTLAELTDVTLTSPVSTNLLQYNGTNWVNVAANTIGDSSFKTFVTDAGTAVADVIGDSISFLGLANGGLRTVGADTPDAIQFHLTPIDLTTTSATIAGGDFLIISDSADGTTDSGQKVTLTKIITDLDIVSGISANGMLVRTAADTYASRTLTLSAVAGDEGLSVVDGDGVAGNPTIGLDVTGLTAEAGTLSATDTFVMFDGTNNVKVNVTQLAAGITASAPLAIDDLSDVTITAAANNEFLVHNGTAWVDTTPAAARTAMDVYSKGESDSNFLDVAGDTMAGNIAMGTNQITGLGTPTNDTDAATKGYADALVAGLTWKNSAVVATTANINLATTALTAIDGVTPVAGDRILVKDQTDATENGIYIAAAGAWVRATDLDSVSPIDEVNSAAVFVEQGSTFADTGWTVTSNVATLGSDDIDWTQFTGASGVTAGAGLVKVGNTLDVNFGAGIAQLPSDEVGIDLFTDGSLRLADTLDGAASTLTGAKLQVLRDGSTLTTSTSGLKVSSGGITAVEINSSVAGDGLEGGSGTVLSLDLKTASGLSFDTGELTLTAIPNAALANAALTLAADTGSSETADLGETVTIAGGTGIDTVVSATNTVTANLNAGIDLLTDVDTTSAAPALGNTLVWDNSNWVPGNPINSTDELTDVTAAATVAGQVLVSDGTDYTPRQIQFVDTQASSTTWTVTHNLNQKFVNVTVYDSTDNMIIPQAVVATSTSVTTITFNTAIAGTAVVMGVNGLAAV